MDKKLKKLISSLFSCMCIISLTLISFHNDVLYASEIDNSILIKKISKSYTKKFCNAIGFGLSKESSMNFSMEENKQVIKKRKEFENINKEILEEEIAISVIEKCGYPINISGEEGILEFKDYYLSKDREDIEK